MTAEQANQINLQTENDVEQLREAAKFWEEKALIAEAKIRLINGTITFEQLQEHFDLERIKQVIYPE